MTKPYLAMLKNGIQNTSIPVWMMRQAGRYLPEYRAIRKQHSFLDMVYTPDIATEITLQPIRRFGFDAAILFSDILVVPQALGMSLTFTEGRGPELSPPIRTAEDVDRLQTTDASMLRPIYTAIQQIIAQKPEATSLIGFAGSPFTVASYMIEGGSSKDLKHTKQLMIRQPEVFCRLLDAVTEVTIEYLVGQCQAGVDALQLFDTWISHLDWQSCQAYSVAYVTRIVQTLRDRGIQLPVTFFGKYTSVFYPLYVESGVSVISLDWGADVARVDANLPEYMGIQGNLDPFVLYGSKAVIQDRVRDICQSITTNRPFIFNLGHGLMPDIPIDGVQYAIDAVRGLSS